MTSEVRSCAACGEPAHLNRTDEGYFYICPRWHKTALPVVETPDPCPVAHG